MSSTPVPRSRAVCTGPESALVSGQPPSSPSNFLALPSHSKGVAASSRSAALTLPPAPGTRALNYALQRSGLEGAGFTQLVGERGKGDLQAFLFRSSASCFLSLLLRKEILAPEGSS